MSEGIRPFDNGTQYRAWRALNCDGCALYNPDTYDGQCEIDGALGLAYLGDGTVTVEISRRMGLPNGAFTWACPEVQPAVGRSEWKADEDGG